MNNCGNYDSNSYNKKVFQLVRRDTLIKMAAECLRLAELDNIPDPILTLGYDSSISNNIINICYTVTKPDISVKPRCIECQFYNTKANYRCIICHRDKELESVAIRIPDEILYKIFRYAGVRTSHINKTFRKLTIPRITDSILSNINKVDSRNWMTCSYSIKRSRIYGIYINGSCKMRLEEKDNKIIKCSSHVHDLTSVKFYVHTTPINIEFNNYLSSIPRYRIQQALRQEFENMMPKELLIKTAYLVAILFSLDQEISDLDTDLLESRARSLLNY